MLGGFKGEHWVMIPHLVLAGAAKLGLPIPTPAASLLFWSILTQNEQKPKVQHSSNSYLPAPNQSVHICPGVGLQEPHLPLPPCASYCLLANRQLRWLKEVCKIPLSSLVQWGPSLAQRVWLGGKGGCYVNKGSG